MPRRKRFLRRDAAWTRFEWLAIIILAAELAVFFWIEGGIHPLR